MRIVGIDPGIIRTGYGVIDSDGSFRLIEAGTIETKSNESFPSRLEAIHQGVRDLLRDTHPDILVLEKIFAHYKHPTTGILMGHARGVICLAAQQEGVPLVNIPSTRVKKAVISHGHASKRQIQMAVQGFLGLKKPPSPMDVSDALAIALAFAFTNREELVPA